MVIDFYISNQGDDSIADGTEIKPFKTLETCIKYLQDNIYTNYDVNINFATDYTEETKNFSIKNVGTRGYLILNGNNHNVIFKGGLSLYLDKFHIKNINFDFGSEVKNPTLYLTENSYGYAENITINNNNASYVNVNTQRGATLILRQKISFTGNNTESLFAAERSSKIIFESSSDTVVDINGSFNAVFNVFNNSMINVRNDVKFTGNGVGKKYNLGYCSCLNLMGRGDSIITASELGTKDETSIIC